MGYNSTLPTPKIEGALLASLKTKKIEYNITQDKSSNYASLAEAIAAVDDDEYKVKGIVLTFYTGTDWVSKRYNGEDASGFADEGNWIDVGGAAGTKVKVISAPGASSITKQIEPNTFYKFEAFPAITIKLVAEESGILNEYMFEFVSGTTATTLSLPDSVKWSGGNAPTIEANKTYQVSIVNNLAVFAAFLI